MTKITDQVRKRITKEQLKPRSKLSIVAEQLGYAALFGLFFLALVLSINWLGFWLRITGNVAFLGQGILGLKAFFGGFPFGLIVLIIVAFGLTILVLRHYDISYKQPLLLLSVGLLVLAVIAGSGLARSGLNEKIAEGVEMGQLAPLRPLYQGKADFSQVSQRGLVGRIKAIELDRIIVITPRGEVEAIISPSTRINDRAELKPGARVHVLGKRVNDSQFEAEVILVTDRTSFLRMKEKFL